MPYYVHRVTFAEFPSTSPASLQEPEANYVKDPDLSAVAGWYKGYWILTGDIFTLMDAAQRAAVDAAEQDARNVDNRALAIAKLTDVELPDAWQLRELIELFNKRDNYLVNRVTELQSAMDAMKASTGNVASLRDAIPATWLATNTRTRAEAIQDYTDDLNAGGADT